MESATPTCYTAVPTMHQAILSRAARNADTMARVPLRIVRSSSASLPPQVMLELAATFKVPVIEGYGMTEVAHQMTSNPLPPWGQSRGLSGWRPVRWCASRMRLTTGWSRVWERW